VESHRININRKLGFTSIVDLVRYAIRNGIVSHS
jgi:DNA-binding CsgD family transcriptional regulator